MTFECFTASTRPFPRGRTFPTGARPLPGRPGTRGEHCGGREQLRCWWHGAVGGTTRSGLQYADHSRLPISHRGRKINGAPR